jgi:hypothetical protein
MYICRQAARKRSRFIRDLERKIVSLTRARREAKLSGRSSIDAIWTIEGRIARFTGKKSWPRVVEHLHSNIKSE